jgi:hypothetical protein
MKSMKLHKGEIPYSAPPLYGSKGRGLECSAALNIAYLVAFRAHHLSQSRAPNMYSQLQLWRRVFTNKGGGARAAFTLIKRKHKIGEIKQGGVSPLQS